MRAKAALLVFIVLMATMAEASGRRFEWDPYVPELCPATYTCGFYILTWEAAAYRAACPADPADVLTDCDKDPNCTEYMIPAECEPALPEPIRVLVTPEGWDRQDFVISRAHFPLLVPGTEYVTVCTAFERPPAQLPTALYQYNESDYSNRLVWKMYGNIPAPAMLRRAP